MHGATGGRPPSLNNMQGNHTLHATKLHTGVGQGGPSGQGWVGGTSAHTHAHSHAWAQGGRAATRRVDCWLQSCPARPYGVLVEGGSPTLARPWLAQGGALLGCMLQAPSQPPPETSQRSRRHRASFASPFPEQYPAEQYPLLGNPVRRTCASTAPSGTTPTASRQLRAVCGGEVGRGHTLQVLPTALG